jgi:hypothetical protein
MAVPTKISALTEALPLDPADQFLVARGSGGTGVSYKVKAQNIFADLFKTIDTPSIKLGFNGTTTTLSAVAGVIPPSSGGTGLTAPPANGQVLIGNGTGYTLTTLTPGLGITITNGTGSILIEHLTHTNEVTGNTSLTIVDDVVTNAKLANVANYTIKGRESAGTGDPEDLTPTQARLVLNVENGANNYIHPVAAWTAKTDLAGTKVISNLTFDSTGHTINWTTRDLGTIATQASNSINITGGTIKDTSIEATTPLKVTSLAGITYATVGQYSSTNQGLIELRNSVGNYHQLFASSATLPNPGATPYSFAGIIGDSNTDLYIDKNIGAKGGIYAYGGLFVQSGGNWSSPTSDLRSKHVLSDYKQGLGDVVKLNPIKFKYKETLDPCPGTNERVGLIAQEVEKVFPNCVYSREQMLDGVKQDLLQLNEKDLTFAFINAFKDLNNKYEEALKRIEMLEASLNK